MTNTMQKWFNKGQEVENRRQIARWCDDVSAFIGTIRRLRTRTSPPSPVTSRPRWPCTGARSSRSFPAASPSCRSRSTRSRRLPGRNYPPPALKPFASGPTK